MIRAACAGVPAVLVGSLVLSLASSPAYAAEHSSASGSATAHRNPLAAAPASVTPVAAESGRPTTAASAPATYTVRPGDTVSGVSARFGLRTVDVLALNSLTWKSTIYPGQVLRLTGAAPTASPTGPGSTTAGTYTIQRGDTISAIARRHAVSTAAVLAANGLQASSIIYPGQQITIPSASAPAPAAGSAATAATSGLDAEQTANAQLIIRVGRDLGVPDRGIAIALGTAMQESWLRNLDWGDRDSLGLFQQRPSTGWGSDDEVRDPVRATRTFFGGASDPNGARTRGLLDIPGWQGMSFAQAAQSVQISAHPDRYTRWEGAANAWLAAWG